jgi:sterol 3beta-glucosyltransferase
MHLVIVTSGSRGDVQPYLALALRARAAGHRVTLATHAIFRPWIESCGVAFRCLHGDPKQMLSNPGGRAWLADGSRSGLWQFVREFRRDFGALLDGLLDDLLTATADADIVLYNAVCMSIAQLRELRGVPVIAGWMQPTTPTRAFPTSGLPYRETNTTSDQRRNEFTHRVGEQLLWQLARTRVNRWRRRAFNAAPLPFAGPFRKQRSPDYPVCYAYSAAVLPSPGDWPAWIAPTGYWFLNSPKYTPSAELEHFLDSGTAPVTIGFGSMTPQDGEWLTRIILEACERAEVRAVLLQGWGSLGHTSLPSWAHAESDVPHDYLYARSCAVVHHGGSGTTGAALRSGTPAVIIPLGFDQQFWGGRTHALGVSPAPINRRELTAEKLAAAMRITQRNNEMRHAAAVLGATIAAEDGIGVALQRIEAHCARG